MTGNPGVRPSSAAAAIDLPKALREGERDGGSSVAAPEDGAHSGAGPEGNTKLQDPNTQYKAFDHHEDVGRSAWRLQFRGVHLELGVWSLFGFWIMVFGSLVSGHWRATKNRTAKNFHQLASINRPHARREQFE